MDPQLNNKEEFMFYIYIFLEFWSPTVKVSTAQSLRITTEFESNSVNISIESEMKWLCWDDYINKFQQTVISN